MRSLDNGTFMTQEYLDWWSAHRETMLRRNTHIILRGLKKNDAPSSTKGDQLQLYGQDKLSLSSKSKVVMVAISTSKVINVVHKRKKSFSPLGKGVEKSLDIVPFCSDASKPPISLDGVAIGSAASSSNESNASQEPYWKHLNKKHKGLSYQHCEFDDLDSISIDTVIFEDGAVGSTMPLADLAHQLGFVEVSSNIFGNDVFGEDCFTNLNPPSVLKSFNLSLDNAMTQASNKDPSIKLPENVESFQNVPTTDMVAEANDNIPSNSPKDLVQPLQQIASHFEPPKAISAFKLSYVFGLWRTLCECITQFSIESSENLKELEKDVSLILKGVASVVQNHLHAANEDKVKMNKRLAELQKILERANKELVARTSNKKKIILLIEEHQKKLSKNQESVTNIEDRIHTLEKICPLSETETNELAKLREIAETSRLQILGHNSFP
ncbi:hypothetical protein CQW23_10121 [Capsicum baccatum]|uniref:Uncharacterized protein n=1 Tax=Capsicum baccatum TaxID=33114 RepID=A0A2G2WYQ1_CAPBA|nr:hypothetical protein CQW23_10121 [Capsicum baccatum]